MPALRRSPGTRLPAAEVRDFVRHQVVTRDELRDWIVEEVRRRPHCAGFSAEFAFVLLPGPDAQGRTWRVRVPTGEATWGAAMAGAFKVAVRQARRAFDLIE